MFVRRLMLCVAILPALVCAAAVPAGEAETPFDPLVQEDIADLRTQLKSGLKCRRDVEFAFVELIAQMTDSGQLSEELVKGTFQWARRKKPYPFPYFERGIRERAAAVGVAIP